jgi:alkylation response protein AidB-like acyl-CoA dehydrogenase
MRGSSDRGGAHPHEADDSLAELVSIVRRFAEGLPSPLLRDHDGSLGPALLAEARSLGLYGLAIPEAYGGAGLGLGEVAVLVAELARVDRSLATSVGLHNGLGSRSLVESGSSELRARYLPELASGRRIGAFGATEPAAGSDLSAIRTLATTVGEALVISGEKAYVTNAGLAGVFTVLCKSGDPSAGTTLVLVPRETDGLTLGAEEHKLGLRASSTRSVFFDGARVPADHRIGREGRGVMEAQIGRAHV